MSKRRKYDTDWEDYRAQVLAECDGTDCPNPAAHEHQPEALREALDQIPAAPVEREGLYPTLYWAARALLDAAERGDEGERLNCSPTEHTEDGYCHSHCRREVLQERLREHAKRTAKAMTDSMHAPAAPVGEPLCRCGHGTDPHDRRLRCTIEGCDCRGFVWDNRAWVAPRSVGEPLLVCPDCQVPLCVCPSLPAPVPVSDEAEGLTEQERELLGGPDGPWIKDDWDGLLEAIESILATRLAGAGAQVTEAAEAIREHAATKQGSYRDGLVAAANIVDAHMGTGQSEACPVCAEWETQYDAAMAEVERQRKRADAEAQLRQMGKLTRSEDSLNKLRAERDDLRARISALADEWKRLRKTELSFLAQRKTADAVEWCERELRALLDRTAAEGDDA